MLFVGSLLHPAHEPELDSEFTLCALAVCNSGAHVRKKPLRRLLNIANSKHTVGKLPHLIYQTVKTKLSNGCNHCYVMRPI